MKFTKHQVKTTVRRYVESYNEGNWAYAHARYRDLCDIIDYSSSKSVADYAMKELDSLDREGYLSDY